ncbi:hypothetical protein PtA15_15A397 [Puccinia triticina]|uniref:Uncharacterized protein n=1 Tax=Puccinia triticina TaxID=208348 RepID=A0ABY7D315_9BASI|nr:uncharacterized protein PtA15_15A397 [Puccinia triticina]WAQ92003.1 hypothetical protein PtA15_15A397 [Puccinia triticina]
MGQNFKVLLAVSPPLLSRWKQMLKTEPTARSSTEPHHTYSAPQSPLLQNGSLHHMITSAPDVPAMASTFSNPVKPAPTNDSVNSDSTLPCWQQYKDQGPAAHRHTCL